MLLPRAILMSSVNSPRSVRRKISPIAVGRSLRTASTSARSSGEVGAVEVVSAVGSLHIRSTRRPCQRP
jgi:hypothetical protein